MLITKLFENITIIKSGRSILGKVPHFTHAFIIDDLLIDTGPPCCKKELLAFCRDRKILKVINTHHHEDHVGGNKLLQDYLGVEVYAHPLAAKLIADLPPLQFYRKFIWGKPENSTVQPITEYIETSAGRNLKIVHTPGHCDDHICLFDESGGLLFTGDAFLHPRIKVYRSDENFQLSLISLKKMEKLKPTTLFCSLNGRLSNARDLLRRKIDFMENLARDTMKLKKKGYSNKKIQITLLGKENSFFYVTLGHFSKQNLIHSILSQEKFV